jgi:Rieske 2Fe-2S family protein
MASVTPIARIDSELARTRAPVAQASHPPGVLYTSPEIFEIEKQQIFMKDWLCVGRAEEVENPGDYMTTRILGEPVVIVRDKTGTINAFSNICLHRGVEIASGEGNKKVFSCPFHGWSYGLDGRLIGAPHMRETEGFDPANCRLPELRLGLWHGWIFISFDPNAVALEQHMASLEADFSFLQLDNYRLAIKTVNEVDCNWKLVVENLIDFYHLNVVHTTTNGRKFTKEAFEFSPRAGGGYMARFNSGPSTPSGEPIFGRAPWLDDLPQNFSTTGLLPPNFSFFARIDTIHPQICWPLSPTRTRAIVYTLLPRVYFDQPQFQERVKPYQDYQNTVLAEDRAMLESVQNGIASRAYRPGRMAHIERGVHHVINGYIDRMGDAIKPVLERTRA